MDSLVQTLYNVSVIILNVSELLRDMKAPNMWDSDLLLMLIAG